MDWQTGLPDRKNTTQLKYGFNSLDFAAVCSDEAEE